MEIEVTLKTPHPKQREFLDNRARFNVLKCGRRFGKTEISQELISEIIETGGIIAYYSPTYKDLYETWQESKRVFKDIIVSSSETVKQIIFIGGAKLDMWSMEDPDSGRGRKYHRIIVDECEKAHKFKEAWQQTMRATLTDFKGDAYLLSTPQFGDTFFKEIAKLHEKSPEWRTFIYTTYDNPYIDPEEINDARMLLPESVFRCEYMAEDLDGMASNPFAHQYDQDKHESEIATFEHGKQLYISIDFNLNPFAVTFWHHWQDLYGYHWHGIGEAEIVHGSIPAMIDLIRTRYGHSLHSCIVTGDAMGNQGQIALRDNSSHYQSIQRELGLSRSQIQVPANPTHANSRDDVNRILFEAKQPGSKFHFYLNPLTMPNTCRDFRMVQCDAFGGIMKGNRKDINQRGDYMDTARYLLNLTAKQIILKMRK